MTAVLSRTDNKLPPPVSAFQGIVGREPYPVTDKAGEIVRRLLQFGVTRFRALFKGNRSRSEVVATFLAVLELCKARRVGLYRHLHPGGGGDAGGVYRRQLLRGG